MYAEQTNKYKSRGTSKIFGAPQWLGFVVLSRGRDVSMPGKCTSSTLSGDLHFPGKKESL